MAPVILRKLPPNYGPFVMVMHRAQEALPHKYATDPVTWSFDIFHVLSLKVWTNRRSGRQHINQTLHNVTESRWIIGRGILLTITGITKLVAHHLGKHLLLVCSMMVPIYITNENIQLQCINWEAKLDEDYQEYNNFRIYGIRSNYNIDTNNSYSFLRVGCLKTKWIFPSPFFLHM